MRIDEGRKGMRRGWLVAVLAAAALAWPGFGSAQQQAQQQVQAGGAQQQQTQAGIARPAAQRITLQQALQLALSRNSAIRTAENATEQQAITVRQQKYAFLPSLQLSTSGSQSVGRAFSQDEGQIVTTTTQSFNAGISSGVTLFDGFRNIANLKSAQLSETASEYTLERTRQTVALAVATDYIALVEAAEQVRVRREALSAEESVAEQIRVFVNAGTRPIADLYQQQASAASARAALVQAERTLERARTDVLETLQLDATGDYEFVAPDLSAVPGGESLAPVDTLIARAVRNRVDLDAQEAKVAAAEQGVRAAAASRWPTVSLNAGYNTGASSVSELSFSDQLDQRRGGSLGLSVSVPIFDRLSRQSATEQARLAADNASIELQAQRRQIGLEVRRAWVDYQAAAAQVSASEAQLQAAELALTAVTERYRLGAATLVEVSQARATQIQAASALVTGRNTLVLQRALITYYTGDLDPETPVIG